MMMMMMMLNVNECFLGDTKTKREYIARKHIFSFKVSLFLFFLFFFYFFFQTSRERGLFCIAKKKALCRS